MTAEAGRIRLISRSPNQLEAQRSGSPAKKELRAAAAGGRKRRPAICAAVGKRKGRKSPKCFPGTARRQNKAEARRSAACPTFSPASLVSPVSPASSRESPAERVSREKGGAAKGASFRAREEARRSAACPDVRSATWGATAAARSREPCRARRRARRRAPGRTARRAAGSPRRRAARRAASAAGSPA